MKPRATSWKKIKNYVFDPYLVAVWLEKYNKNISSIWNRLPQRAGQIISTLAIIALGISVNGDWLNIFIHVAKQTGYLTDHSSHNATVIWPKFQNFWTFWISSCIISYTIYFVIGGFLHWYYYVRQRDRAHEWKCQPQRWLTPSLEKHEIMLGSSTLLLNATTSALLACYIANGGYSKVYYNVSDYGIIWFLLQFVVLFIYVDYTVYWLHRLYHLPFLYKKFHKLHHKYKQPTAFSVTAIHPVESLHIQCTLVIPLFILPIHWFSFYSIAIYNYYHGIIDHSGINFKAQWWQPWQPDAIFHDNHHQYFHVNFGFNIQLWDRIHGTERREDRVYREDIFYGKGKSFNELSISELKADLFERNSENLSETRRKQLTSSLAKNIQNFKKSK